MASMKLKPKEMDLILNKHKLTEKSTGEQGNTGSMGFLNHP